MVVPVVGQAQSVASDQRSPVPRTPWGDPDLQGLWNFATNTPLQRPSKYVGREWLTEEEVAAEDLEWSTFVTSSRRSELTARYDLSLNFNQFWWDLGRSTGRTSLITDPADGRWPRLTPSRQGYEASDEWQRLQTVDWGLAPARGPEELGFSARCLLDRQVPIIPSSDNNHVQILQSPGYVVVLHEKIHDVRIVPVIDLPDVPDQVRQWLGVSRGRWEGDTLVAETKNFHAQADYFGSGVDRHVIERFTRRGEDAIEYSFTVTDPSRLDAAVERDGAVARSPGAALRVRVSRGELQCAAHLARSPCRRERSGQRSIVMTLEVGSRLGHYDVIALIGEGGMGQVDKRTDI